MRPLRFVLTSLLGIALALALLAPASLGQRSSYCNDPAPQPITLIDLPGNPFQAIPSADGCWIFVSLTRADELRKPGIAVLQHSGGKTSLVRVVPTPPGSTGMVLTHDGSLLIVARQQEVLFFDAPALISGHSNPLLGIISDGDQAGSIYVNTPADDKFLFIADESAASITVVNLERARADHFSSGAVVGKIPTGGLPIALTFSPDERYLYTTSEFAAKDWGWPDACDAEGPRGAASGQRFPEGAIVVVDVSRAKTDPANSVVAKVPAGCSTVRLALSPRGDRAYVTARNSNAVLAFDTARLTSDPGHARIASVPVGTAPVGVITVEDGAKIIATNSNRFGGSPDDKQTLTVIDAAKIASGATAVIGSVPAGAFPRELRLTSDGRTLLLTNFNSNTLEIIDIARLPVQH